MLQPEGYYFNLFLQFSGFFTIPFTFFCTTLQISALLEHGLSPVSISYKSSSTIRAKQTVLKPCPSPFHRTVPAAPDRDE